ILAWSLPTMWVRTRAKARLEEMGRGMPDMLDLLNMCVSQGMTVPTALARVSKELDPVYPALAKELKIVTDQARVGTLDQALRGLSNRVDIPEVHSFTSLLIQTERMGTSMSEALTEHSDNMRESFRQRADEKANAATFKLLFPTVLCLMPAVFMFLLGPAMIELNDFFTGRGQEILNASNQGMQTSRQPGQR
ncbi:MAG TPA: type II secretion system F family protein, partial [Caulifigura sp.]|nr:type II secretion system F family protein [Caulifigura sp.]